MLSGFPVTVLQISYILQQMPYVVVWAFAAFCGHRQYSKILAFCQYGVSPGALRAFILSCLRETQANMKISGGRARGLFTSLRTGSTALIADSVPPVRQPVKSAFAA